MPASVFTRQIRIYNLPAPLSSAAVGNDANNGTAPSLRSYGPAVPAATAPHGSFNPFPPSFRTSPAGIWVFRTGDATHNTYDKLFGHKAQITAVIRIGNVVATEEINYL